MFKINLEEVLKRQHKKVITPKELLAIEQYDKLAEDSILAILNRTGFEGTYKDGEDIKAKLQAMAATNAVFPQDQVYHISQIEKLCKKYRLKFLPTKLYRGQVPPNIADILVQHERDFNFKLQPDSCFIVAPAGSFQLKAKPEDPLLFHKINDEHYFLLHKWGNDLSATRAILRYTQPSIFTFLITIAACILSRHKPLPVGVSINERTLGILVVGIMCSFFIGWLLDNRFEYNKDEK